MSANAFTCFAERCPKDTRLLEEAGQLGHRRDLQCFQSAPESHNPISLRRVPKLRLRKPRKSALDLKLYRRLTTLEAMG